MEHDLVLEGKVVTPGGVLETEVGVDGDSVTEIGHSLKGYRRIRTQRCVVFPGFVDIHVHLREPGWEQKEDFRTGSKAAAHGGVTTVVDMPNNPVPTSNRSALDAKKRLALAKGMVNVEFYGGVEAGRLGNIPELASGVVGYKVYLSQTTGTGPFPVEELGSAFAAIAKTGRPAHVHCESQSVIDRMQRKLAGTARPDVHCDVRPPEAEERAVDSVVESMKGAGVRVNVCHASVRGTLSSIRKGREEGLRLSCEAALHHLFFNRKAALDSRMLKTNPPLRSEEDREALVEGVRDGTVSFLVTDHAPHTWEEKTVGGASGVPGLDDYGHLVSWLARVQGVDPLQLARAASSNPAGHLGLKDRGSIAVGMRADLAVLDLHSPEVVKNEDVKSRCGWSPYEGFEFPGRVRWTVVGGKTLMDDGELVI